MLKNKMKWSYDWLSTMRDAYKSGYIHTPVWLQHCLAMPPVRGPLPAEPNKKIVYPEDKLLWRIRDKHPEFWDNTVIYLVDSYAVPRDYQHPSTIFLDKQIEFMKKGFSEEKAFYLTEQEYKKKEEYNLIEWRIHMQQAGELGVDEKYLTEEDKEIDKEYETIYQRHLSEMKEERKSRLQKYFSQFVAEVYDDSNELNSKKKILHKSMLERSITIQDLSSIGVKQEDLEHFLQDNPSNEIYFRDLKNVSWGFEEELPNLDEQEYYLFQKFLVDQIDTMDNPQEFVRHMLLAPEMRGLEHYFALAQQKYLDFPDNNKGQGSPEYKDEMYMSEPSDVEEANVKNAEDQSEPEEIDLKKRYSQPTFESVEATDDEEGLSQQSETDVLPKNFRARMKNLTDNMELEKQDNKNKGEESSDDEKERRRKHDFEGSYQEHQLDALLKDPLDTVINDSEAIQDDFREIELSESELDTPKAPSIFSDPPRKKLIKIGASYYQMDFENYEEWRTLVDKFNLIFRNRAIKNEEAIDNSVEPDVLAPRSNVDESDYEVESTDVRKFGENLNTFNATEQAKEQIDTMFTMNAKELGLQDKRETSLNDLVDTPIFKNDVYLLTPDLNELSFFHVSKPPKYPILRDHFLMKGQDIHSFASKLYHISPSTIKEDEFTDKIQFVFRGGEKATNNKNFAKSVQTKQLLRSYLRELVSTKKMEGLINSWISVSLQKENDVFSTSISPLIKIYQSLEKLSEEQVFDLDLDEAVSNIDPLRVPWPQWITQAFSDPQAFFSRSASELVEDIFGQNLFISKFNSEKAELFSQELMNDIELIGNDASKIHMPDFDPVLGRLEAFDKSPLFEAKDFRENGLFSNDLFEEKLGIEEEEPVQAVDEDGEDLTEDVTLSKDDQISASSSTDRASLLDGEIPDDLDKVTDPKQLDVDVDDENAEENINLSICPDLLGLLDSASSPSFSELQERFSFSNAYRQKIVSYFTRADSATRFHVAAFLSVANVTEVVEFFNQVIDHEDKFLEYTLANRPYHEELAILKKFKQLEAKRSQSSESSPSESVPLSFSETQNFWRDLNETAVSQNQASQSEIAFFQQVVSSAYNTLKTKAEQLELPFDNNLRKLRASALKSDNKELLGLIDVAERLDNILLKKKGESPSFEPVSPEELSNYFYMFPNPSESQSLSSLRDLDSLKNFITFSFKNLPSEQQTVNKLVGYLDSNLLPEDLRHSFSSLDNKQLYNFVSDIISQFSPEILDTIHRNDYKNQRSYQNK